MARKRRSYRRGFKAGRRYRKKQGLFGGFKMFDIGQGAYNASRLGYIGAAQSAMNGDFQGALERDLLPPLTNPGTMIDVSVGNIIIGVNRKILRAFGGKFVRRFIA